MNKKTVLVTGATGGIGSVLCRHLASNGYDLILSSRTKEKLEILKTEVESLGAKAHVLPIDFSSDEYSSQIKSLSSFGLSSIDGLVLMPAQAQATTDCLPGEDVWNTLFSTSFSRPLSLVNATLPFLKKSERAKVVVISGITSVQVLGHYATSNVLRAAWLAETKTLAFKYGPENIHFNTLSLGGVLTKRYSKKLQNKAKDNSVSFEQQMTNETSNVPLGKYATPEEVSKSVEGLLSSFSDHITGMNIVCDGGFTRAY